MCLFAFGKLFCDFLCWTVVWLFPHIIVSPLYTIPLWYVFTSDNHAAMLMPTPTATLLRTTVV